MAVWSKLEDGTLSLLVSCVAYGHPHDSPDGWVGGVPPLRRTLLSRQYCSDGCLCWGVAGVNIRESGQA